MLDNSNTINETIGLKIEELLESQGKKQKDLAEYLNINSNIVSYWCNGTRKPNIEQIIEISKYFNVSTDYILDVSENKTTDTNLKAVCEYVHLKDDAVQALHNNPIYFRKFLDFALCSDVVEDFKLFCQQLEKYRRSLSELLIEQTEFVIYPLPNVKNKEELHKIYKDFNSLKESIDVNEYKTIKAFSELLSLFKNKELTDFDNGAMQERFNIKWMKFLRKIDKLDLKEGSDNVNNP